MPSMSTRARAYTYVHTHIGVSMHMHVHETEDEIQEIFEALYSEENDLATAQLDEGLAPQMSVTLGSVELDGICQPKPTVAPNLPDVGGKKSGIKNFFENFARL